MKYWILINNQQIGPLDEAELRNYPVTPTTPVWAEGMPDWTEIGRLDNLKWLFAQQQPQQPYGSSYQQPYGAQGQPQYAQGQPQYAPGQQPWQGATMPMTEPPTNLVWAILTTIFCCLPFGVVSIVYAAQVSSAWARGDQARAQRYSKNAATWAIVSAVCGLVGGGVSAILGLFGSL